MEAALQVQGEVEGVKNRGELEMKFERAEVPILLMEERGLILTLTLIGGSHSLDGRERGSRHKGSSQ